MAGLVATARTTRPGSGQSEQFEAIYADAAGDPSRIPWCDGRANPALVTWMNAIAPSVLRCGARVAVPGCGLGEDARELIHRGYDVTAFDFSPTAVEWARSIDPSTASSFVEADLFDPPTRWTHRFDLVVEVYTIQSMPPARRDDTARALARLVSPHGHLLVICRGTSRAAGEADGPPWPLTRDELVDCLGRAGLVPVGGVDEFTDGGTPPVPRIRALFERAPATAS